MKFKAKMKVLPVKCNLCDYSCMEGNNMKKPINNTHVKQKWNVCQKMFVTSVEVLQHVASEHLHDEEPAYDRGQRQSESSQENHKGGNNKQEAKT